ncbi:DUF721 domain-containing protein [Devosia sp.]|uniref:DUF721 domain-containing protein n=1 Tax=Devosia sp. TaxID=1871048 RepID=UPI003A8F0A08
MAPKTPSVPKRLNRAVPLNEALGKALDPALKRRGFATRDLLMHWASMAPTPYDKVARPDKLVWPRGEKGAEGAVLFLSCHPGHALALSHEGERVAAAINRYFGYLLVHQVRMSATPFDVEVKAAEAPDAPLSADRQAEINSVVEQVEDPAMRAALRDLGAAIARRKTR